ncbi:MAG: 2-oxo acid dehydrogenase subunit E2 [Desulfobacteraceae bacterium]|nr:2-oxo acid dehydrogenase subunit E2 [Desulfobacteraceae bacterium]
MATKIMMPQAGQDITEGRVVKWLKAEGDTVKQGEPICEVETEKVVFEVESPVDGVLLKIIVPDGEKTQIFSTIGIVGAQGEEIDLDEFLAGDKEEKKGVDVSDIRKRLGKKEAVDTGKVKISGRARKLAEKKGVDLSTIEGTGPGGRIVEKDVMRAAEEGVDGKVRISPVARKMAEDHGIEIDKMKGTGPGDRIMKEDVERAAEEKARGKAVADKPVGAAFKEVKEVVPIRGVRQVIFERMHESLQQSAQLTITMEVDAAELVRFRKVLGEGPEDERIRVSYNAILVKILARVLEEHPQMNSSVVGDGIWLWESVNLGVAMDAPGGLVVPVVRNANEKDLLAIQKEMDELASKVRSKKLVPGDLQGGTFTLTSLGFLDVEAFTPILNPPETGILGVGKIVEKPVVENGEIKVGQRMVLSLTFDHRIVDGADGGRFLKRVKTYIEKPYHLIAIGS